MKVRIPIVYIEYLNGVYLEQWKLNAAKGVKKQVYIKNKIQFGTYFILISGSKPNLP